MNKFIKGTSLGIGAGVLGVAFLIFITLLSPLAAIIVGWVIGTGLQFIAGEFVASGLSLLLHTTITPILLPKIFAAIALVACFFNPIIKASKNNN